MQPLFGEIVLKIDTHTHIIPENIPNFSKKFGYEGFVSMANKTSEKADMVIFGEKFRTIKCKTNHKRGTLRSAVSFEPFKRNVKREKMGNGKGRKEFEYKFCRCLDDANK